MPTKILISDRFSLPVFAKLKSNPHYDVSFVQKLTAPTKEELSTANALIIRSGTKISESLLESAPNLKVIVTATSGFDHINLEATNKYNVKVMFTPEANATAAAELTLGLMISCNRKLIEANRAVKSGEWRREHFLGHELNKKICGIVGIGRIGSQVARLAQAFGMQLLAFDPFVEDDRFELLNCQRVSFDELLIRSDIVTFHVPLTHDTHHMIHRGSLENISPHSILINCSRGTVVCEEDLVECLTKNKIGAVGLDVFEKEPLPRNSKLLQFPNVIMSPHIGALTEEAFQRASEMAAEKVCNFFEHNGELTDRLPPDARWFHEYFYSNKD